MKIMLEICDERSIPQKIKCTLTTPLFIFFVGLMIVNDHILKGSSIIPQQFTGKLSDFAFLFFVPVVVCYLFRVKTMRTLILSYLSVGVLFAAINISANFSQFVELMFDMAFIPLSLWPDITDITAMIMLPCSFMFLLKAKSAQKIQRIKYKQLSIVFVSLIACIATSPHHRHWNEPTHEPIYMPWSEFRESAHVMVAQDIKRRGKIYIKDQYLYINEPNKGIHIFDNTNPEEPIAKCFLNIPGNTDISIKGSYLYADSFVDLLVFALTIYPQDIILVKRINDVFPYNPSQTMPLQEPEDENLGVHFYPASADRKKGVVIGWRMIQRR